MADAPVAAPLQAAGHLVGDLARRWPPSAPTRWPGSRRRGPGAHADPADGPGRDRAGAGRAAVAHGDRGAHVGHGAARSLEARLGLPAATTDRLDVGSPVPLRSPPCSTAPPRLPDRRAPERRAAIHDELARLITRRRRADPGPVHELAGHAGRASRRCAPVLEYPVLAQNDLPKARLVEAFAADDAACLFATMSFWQGIDVPGATLSLVAIDRHPLPPSRRPAARGPQRERAGEAAFRMVDLPRAATLARPGGRAPHPLGHRRRRRRRPRPAAGHGRLPAHAARRAPAHAAHHRRGRGPRLPRAPRAPAQAR